MSAATISLEDALSQAQDEESLDQDQNQDQDQNTDDNSSDEETQADDSDQGQDDGGGDDSSDQNQDQDDDGDDLPDDVKGLRKALVVRNGQVAELKDQISSMSGKLEVIQQFIQPQSPNGVQKTEEQLQEERDALLNEMADDPEGFINTRIVNVARQLKLQSDVEDMREANKDYDKVIREFQIAAKESPELRAEFDSARNQAKFAYNKGKQIMEFRNLNVSNMEEYRAHLRAQWEAEQKAAQGNQAQIDAASQVPKSTATARGGGSAPQPAFTGPPSLKELLPE